MRSMAYILTKGVVQSDLTDDSSTSQHRVWNYLFNFIKDVDLFLAVSFLKLILDIFIWWTTLIQRSKIIRK